MCQKIDKKFELFTKGAKIRKIWPHCDMVSKEVYNSMGKIAPGIHCSFHVPGHRDLKKSTFSIVETTTPQGI